jgi:hypothetical protein
MAFDPNQLPPSVRSVYEQGPIAWPQVVQHAIGVNIKSLNKLTDIVFYLHYPERIGKPLKANETDLIAKWQAFRTLIKPRLQAMIYESEKLKVENMATPWNGGGWTGMSWSKVDFE